MSQGSKLPVEQLAKFSDLYFIKTSNQVTDQTEVHIALSASSYGDKDASWFSTAFGPAEGDNSIFSLGKDADLYAIRTNPATPPRVGIHRVTASSKYQLADLHSDTPFERRDADHNTFKVDGLVLYGVDKGLVAEGGREEFVKIFGTQNYKDYSVQAKTQISTYLATRGTWDVRSEDLYFIHYYNTNDGKVHLHTIKGSAFTGDSSTPTQFSVDDADKGVWKIGAGGDLYFIKTQDTPSGKVEVRIATAESQYNTVYAFTSRFPLSDVKNGLFIIS